MGTQRLRRHTGRRESAAAPGRRGRHERPDVTGIMTDDLLAGQTWQQLLRAPQLHRTRRARPGRPRYSIPARCACSPGRSTGSNPRGWSRRASPPGRRRHRHRPRHHRRPPRGDRRHRAGLPGRRHRRGVRRQDLPGAAAGRRGLAGGHADRRGDPVRDRRRPAAGSQPRASTRSPRSVRPYWICGRSPR